jgi:hypothetical protein
MNRRRALSTVVTTAIMLTAVAAIGTAVVAWSNTSLRTYEFNLATSASDKTNKINEMLIIENVVLQPTLIPFVNAINITVTNTGTVGLNVTQIQVSDSSTNISVPNGITRICSYFTCPSWIHLGIPPHSSGSFYHTFQWSSNKIVTIQVTTVRGTTLTTQAMHP